MWDETRTPNGAALFFNLDNLLCVRNVDGKAVLDFGQLEQPTNESYAIVKHRITVACTPEDADLPDMPPLSEITPVSSPAAQPVDPRHLAMKARIMHLVRNGGGSVHIKQVLKSTTAPVDTITAAMEELIISKHLLRVNGQLVLFKHEPIPPDVRLEILKRAKQMSSSIAQLARDLGVTAPYIHQMLTGRANVSDNLFEKLNVFMANNDHNGGEK